MSPVNTDPKAIEWFLEHAVERVLPDAASFKAKLLKGERIRVYLGIDPTGPTIHMGHLIPVQKLAELQALGHEVVLLMGDFTAMIGDPTDKSAARKRLTHDEVLANLKGYKDQLAPFLKFDGPNPVQIRFNSEWLAKMSFSDVVELAAHFTVQQMSERDMFEKRIEEGKPVYLHEFMYPLMQGYDSVALEVDLEVGGNDQMFNMLAGRTLLREIKGKEKFVMTCKLLADPTGKKMGKSEGNMISLMDTPEDAYGKIMSWPDTMIIPGFDVLTSLTNDLDQEKAEIAKRQAQIEAGENPMALKKELAQRVVVSCFGTEAANRASDHFANVHQDGALPERIEEMKIVTPSVSLIEALVLAGLAESKTDARRQIEQNAVKVAGVVVTDVKLDVLIPEDGVIIQKGKRGFIKLIRA